ILTARAAAEGIELEPHGAVALAHHGYAAAFDFHGAVGRIGVIRELGEQRAQPAWRVGVSCRQIGPGLSELPQAVIAIAPGRDDLYVPLDELDRRQEALALQTTAVKVARRHVGSGH